MSICIPYRWISICKKIFSPLKCYFYITFLCKTMFCVETLWCLAFHGLVAWNPRAASSRTCFCTSYLLGALVNYEMIKCFTNEKYEIDIYSKLTQKCQKYSISVQASRSIANGSRAIIIEATSLIRLV